MRTVVEYRQNAQECRRLAELMAKPADRRALELMAKAWDKLAKARVRELEWDFEDQ
jgi:hypothetical protein